MGAPGQLCGWPGSGSRPPPLPRMQVQRGAQQEVRRQIQALGLSRRLEWPACPSTSRPGPGLTWSPSEPLPRPLFVRLGSPGLFAPLRIPPTVQPHSTLVLLGGSGPCQAARLPSTFFSTPARPLQPSEHPHLCSALQALRRLSSQTEGPAGLLRAACPCSARGWAQGCLPGPQLPLCRVPDAPRWMGPQPACGVSVALGPPEREGHSSRATGAVGLVAAVRDPVPDKPQASAVVLDVEERAEPGGCAAHTKLLRVPGSSVPPVGAPPLSVLFCAYKFSVAKKRPENQNPWATGSCLWLLPQTVVKAFAFTTDHVCG